MGTLKAVIKHTYFLPSVYITLIVLIVFLAGPYFAFAGYVPLQGLITRILLCAIIIASYSVYRYILYLKKQNQQNSLVKAISDSDDIEQAVGAESHALKSKFVDAFALLKKTKGAPTSLIELPWYMIIGSPGSGKTTLLSNSGLEFPLAEKLNTKHLDGIGGTKNCDWWITNEAVLLDTAGRYTSQDSFQAVDQSGWMNFLNLIKRYRKKPISGLLVSISMSDILSMNEYELGRHINQLKRRISEVNLFFKTEFPIYVLITKTDMLAGFTQFYDSFSHKEREQAFGITLDNTLAREDQYDPKDEFSRKFTDLLKSVSRRQWPRMSMERDISKKAQIYSFGDQLASLQQALSNIIVNLGQSEQNLDETVVPGIVRGLYFTSGTQNGAPIDRMLSRISALFGLRHAHHTAWNNDQRSYFIKDVLQNLIFKEADNFGTLAAYQLRKKRVKQAALSLFSIASMLVCISLYASFKNNENYLSLGTSIVDRWLAQYQTNSQLVDKDIREYIPALNDYANDMSGLSALQDEHFSGLGLDQERSVNKALSASYERLLETVLLPLVEQEMVLQMQDRSKPVLQYQALKSYLMFIETERRDNQYLTTYLLNNMNERETFTDPEYAQVQAHLRGLINSELPIKKANNTIIDAAREALNAQPLDEIYYQQFRNRFVSNKANYQSTAQLAGSDWRSVFSTDLDDVYTLSDYFTPAMFKEIVNTEIDAYLDNLNSETWVLGPNEVINPDTLKDQLEQLYAQDYVQQWQNLLNSVSVKKTTDLASLLTTLPILTENSNPIFTLLDTVSSATNLMGFELPVGERSNLSQKLGQGIAKAQSTFNADGAEFFVTSRFSKLHEMMKKEKRLSTEQRLSALMQETNIALNLQAKDLQTISKPQSLQTLEGFGYLQLDPLSRWVDELVSSVKIAQSQIRKTQLSNIWQSQVLNQCRTITASKYPFEKQSNQNASLQEIHQIFGKNGNIFNFFNTHLAELVNTQTDPWIWASGIQQQYQFAAEVLPFFERSFNIQRTLFAKNPTQATQELSLTPVYLDPKLAQIKMTLFGTNLSYQFGRPTAVSVTWPPKNPERQSDIIFVRRDGSELVLSESGIFALFRLIDPKQVVRIASNEVQVTFSKNEVKSIYKLSTNDSSDPLLLSRLDQFACLTSL